MKAKERVAQRRLAIESWLESKIEDYLKAKDVFIKKVLADPTEAFKWNAEVLVTLQVQAKEMTDVLEAWKRWGSKDPHGFLKAIKEERDKMQRHLLESPYKHNSTSAISNILQAWEKEAKAGMVVSTFGGGLYGNIISALEKLIEAIKQLETETGESWADVLDKVKA